MLCISLLFPWSAGNCYVGKCYEARTPKHIEVANLKLFLVRGRNTWIVLMGFKLLFCRPCILCCSSHLGHEQMEGVLNGFTSAYSTVTIMEMLGVASQFSIAPLCQICHQVGTVV